jgi:hypothetical protein
VSGVKSVPQRRSDITIIMAPMWNVGWPWLAPAYICEALRQAGFSVQFLDCNIDLYHKCKPLGYGCFWENDAYIKAWASRKLDHLVRYINLDDIQGNVIGFSTTHSNLSFSIALASRIRMRFPRRRIIFGGHAVFLPHEAASVPF